MRHCSKLLAAWTAAAPESPEQLLLKPAVHKLPQSRKQLDRTTTFEV